MDEALPLLRIIEGTEREVRASRSEMSWVDPIFAFEGECKELMEN